MLRIIEYLGLLWPKHLPLRFAFALNNMALLPYCSWIKFGFCMFALQASAANGYERVVIDQHGNPLANAVVVLKGSPFTASELPIVIDQVNKQFLPKVIAVPVGQFVSFPNSDNIRHHVYSFSKTNPFEIKLYAGRAAQPIAFNHAGAVVIGCNIHDDMVGYIFVSEHRAVVSNAKGIVEIPDDIAAQQIGLWHPSQYDDITKINHFTSSANNTAETKAITLMVKVKSDKKTQSKSTFKSRFSNSQ